MNKKSTSKFAFVVDASIAHAAGFSDDIRSETCRLVLESIQKTGHRIVLSESIISEWNRHKSNFANRWLIYMISKRKTSKVVATESAEFRDAILTHFGEERVPESREVLKDAHLIEAAIRSDKRIVSLDDKARRHLLGMSRSFHALHEIMWANPTQPIEKAIPWIEKGAKYDKSRLLKL